MKQSKSEVCFLKWVRKQVIFHILKTLVEAIIGGVSWRRYSIHQPIDFASR